MRRLAPRVHTLMLLVVIVALGFELVMRERRHRGREAELAERLQVEKELKNVRIYLHKQEIKELQGVTSLADFRAKLMGIAGWEMNWSAELAGMYRGANRLRKQHCLCWSRCAGPAGCFARE